MDKVLPGTPERIYNLMFASGFIKDFLAGNQKLLRNFFLFSFFNFEISKCPIGLLYLLYLDQSS